MWQELTNTMVKLIKAYQELQAINKEKRKVLVSVDMKGLEEVTKKEQSVIATIGKLERSRQDALREMENKNPKIHPEMSFRELLQQCSDSVQRENLQKLRQLLDKLVKDVQKATDDNSIIVKAALNAVNISLNKLSGTTVEQSYGQRGQEQVSHFQNFDFKA